MTDDSTNTPQDFRPEARAPRGFADKRARDLRAERAILEAVSAVYERYGFEALDTGAFEYADALGKFLPDSDRPNEGVFALQDDDDQWMALRYDLTAPLARFAAQNWETLPKPFRRYAFGPVWRNEKPGPGRFRQFIQCDADTVGSARPEADAEIIAMAVEGLEAAGLPRGAAVLKINNRKLLNGLLTSAGAESAGQKLAVLRAVDKLDRLGVDGVRLLLGEGRLDESGDFTKGAGLKGKAIELGAGLRVGRNSWGKRRWSGRDAGQYRQGDRRLGRGRRGPAGAVADRRGPDQPGHRRRPGLHRSVDRPGAGILYRRGVRGRAAAFHC